MKYIYTVFVLTVLTITNCLCQNDSPQLLISQGLPSEIEKILCSPNGNWLAVSANGLVKVFDFSTGAELATLPFSSNSSINEMLFSNDSRFLAIGGYDSGICIYKTLNWTITKRIDDGVFPLSFSPDCKNVAYCDLYNQDAYKSQFGTNYLALTSSKKVIKEYKKKHITVLETENWKEVNEIKLPNIFIQTLGINNRGDLIFNKADSQRSTIFYASLLGENDVASIKGYRQAFPITNLKITPRNKILLQGSNMVQIVRPDLSVYYTEFDSTAIFEDFFFDFDSSGNYAVIGKPFSNYYEIKKIDLRKRDFNVDVRILQNQKFISDNFVTFNFQHEVLLGTTPLLNGITRMLVGLLHNIHNYLTIK